MDFAHKPGLIDYSWELINTINDLIAQAADPEAGLTAGVDALLSATGRPGGALLVQTPEEPGPAYICARGLSPEWETQIRQAESRLRAVAAHVLLNNQPEVGNPYVSLALGLPLVSSLGIEGVLLLEGQPLSDNSVEQISRLGPSLARAIMMWRKGQTAQTRERELAGLHVMAATLESTQSTHDIQLAIVINIRKILQVEAAMLVLGDEEQKGLTIRKGLVGGDEWTYQESLPLDEGLLANCIQETQAELTNKPSANTLFRADQDSPDGLEVRSLICCPLIAAGQVLGAIAVYNKLNGVFHRYDQQVLASMATALANATYNTRLIEKLKLANADLEASRWELLRSRNTLRALFDNIPSSIYIVDRRYNLVAINMSRADRVHLKPSAMVGRKCYQALYGRAEPCSGCRVSDTLFGGASTNRVERSWVNNDQFMEWDISSYPIYDASNQPVQAIMVEQDVTEKRRLEASLAQSEKLAAVGQLAAGVAHEINNPLAAIIANAQILERDLPPDDDMQESVKLIQMAGSRASQVVRNLLGFARKDSYEFSPCDLNDTIHNALILLQHEYVSRPIDMIFDLAPDMPPIVASKDHLQGVWINLLVNAFDSLEGKPGEVRITSRKQGSEFRVTVSDTGKGIPPEKVSRIFEPFYTTKETGRGTGLGLSLCHRIVKQHSGYILVESQVDAGTKFIVVLPGDSD